MSIRQSFSSRFRHQFTSLRQQSQIQSEKNKMGVVNFPFDRCDLALNRLDEIESERFSNHSSTSRQSNQVDNGNGGECSFKISQQNRSSNRYTDIISFDHSLIPGDYLNASLIPPFKSQKGRSYIASQAPLPHTLSTFYEKIIQTKTKLIVNLTPFEERGKIKADQYWPLQNDKQFIISKNKSVQKSLSSTQINDGNEIRYIIRQSRKPILIDKKLQATIYPLTIIEQFDEKKEVELSILHITSWADFGNYSEETFEIILNIIEDEYEKVEKDQKSPIWVHCSAGVGRSGTVIASLLARDLNSNLKDTLQLSSSTISTPAQLMEASIEGASKLIDYERTFRPRMVQNGQQFEMVAAVVAKQIHRKD